MLKLKPVPELKPVPGRSIPREPPIRSRAPRHVLARMLLGAGRNSRPGF